MKYYVMAFNQDGIVDRTPEGSWFEMQSLYLAYRASYCDFAFVAIVPVKPVWENGVFGPCPYFKDENECPICHGALIADCHHYQNVLSEDDEK